MSWTIGRSRGQFCCPLFYSGFPLGRYYSPAEPPSPPFAGKSDFRFFSAR